MRFVFCIILCITGFSASAQWWRIGFLSKKHPPQERPAAIIPVADQSFSRLPPPVVGNPEISVIKLSRSRSSYQAAEAWVIKTAQRNMSLGIYYDASYNFSELAQLYMQQNRFSEAKWYLLQSNNISRRQNDSRHTISNLIDLAVVKANTGNYVQAFQDLAEAGKMAKDKGFDDDIKEIEQTILFLKKKQG